jgi:hypothetical protein
MGRKLPQEELWQHCRSILKYQPTGKESYGRILLYNTRNRPILILAVFAIRTVTG